MLKFNSKMVFKEYNAIIILLPVDLSNAVRKWYFLKFNSQKQVIAIISHGSGQCSHLLLWLSEFESRWSLQPGLAH